MPLKNIEITKLEIVRRMHGWSQRELGMNSIPILHQGTVSLLERGGKTSDETLLAISHALGWSRAAKELLEPWKGEDLAQFIEEI